jgi:hypothetical protein
MDQMLPNVRFLNSLESKASTKNQSHRLGSERKADEAGERLDLSIKGSHIKARGGCINPSITNQFSMVSREWN